MAKNPFDQYGFADDEEEVQPLTPPAATASPFANSAFADEQATNNPFDSFGYAEEPAAPDAEPKGFFQNALDQLIAGTYEAVGRTKTVGGVADLREAQQLEEGTAGVGGRGFQLREMQRSMHRRTDEPGAVSDRAAEVSKYRQQAAEAIARGAELTAKGQDIPMTAATQEFMDPESKRGGWEIFLENPVDIITDLGLRSLPSTAEGLALGVGGGMAAGPAGFGLGLGVGSWRVEMASTILSGLEQAGVDIRNPDSLAAAVADKDLMQRVMDAATKRAVVVGGVDALSGLFGGKMLTPFISNPMLREGANLVAQLGTQSVMGATGEVLGQVAEGVDEINWREAGAEAAGELITGPIEVAGATMSAREERARQREKLARRADLEAALGLGTITLDERKELYALQNDTPLATPPKGPDRKESNTILDELVNRDLSEKDADFLTAEQQLARDNARRAGGDLLDQELAAAEAGAEVGTQVDAERVRLARLRQRADLDAKRFEEETAYAEEQAKEDEARAKIQAEAAARYEQQTRALEQEPAFTAAEQTAAEARKAQEDEAYYQRELQKGDQAVAAEADKPRLGELPAAQTLRQRIAERQATPTVEPAPAVEVAPAPKPELPALPAPRQQPITVSPEGTAVTPEQRAVIGDQRVEKPLQRPVVTVKPRTLRQQRAATRQWKVQRQATIQAARERVRAEASASAASVANELPQPTEAQQAAGNYKKGHVKGADIGVPGLNLAFENAAGDTRNGSTLQDHYGYIKRTTGTDGDQIDAFVNPEIEPAEETDTQPVFVIDQVKADGTFDEHKVMIGYPNEKAAKNAYARNYPKGWRVGSVNRMTLGDLKTWLKGDTSQPITPIQAPTTPSVQETAPSTNNEQPQKSNERTLKQRRQERRFKNKQKGRMQYRLPDGQMIVEDDEDSGGFSISGYDDNERHVANMDVAPLPDGRMQIKLAGVTASMRGQRIGQQMIERAHQEAKDRGTTLVSDLGVSDDQMRVYDALERKGWTIERNPDVNRVGEYTLSNDGKPVISRIEPPAKRQTTMSFAELMKRADPNVPINKIYEQEFEYMMNLEKQIRREGIKNPIKIERLTDGSERIMDGMHRLAAMSRLGIKEAPVVVSEKGVIPRLGLPQKPNKMSVEQAQQALAPILEKLRGLKTQVLATMNDAPAEVRQAFFDDGVTNAKAAYDTKTGEIYIFADAHASEADIVETLLHEGVAHKGLRALLGDTFTSTMLDIYDSVKDTARFKRIAKKYGYDVSDKTQRVQAVDEYIAAIAEADRNPGVLQRIFAAVRAALRDLGLVRTWSDGDIQALLADSRSKLERPAEDTTTAEPRLQYRLEDENAPQPESDPTRPLAQLHRMAATMEDQKGESPKSLIARLKESVSDVLTEKQKTLLGAIPRRYLADFVSEAKMPSINKYLRVAQRVDGRRNELMVAADEIGKRWNKFVTQNKDQGRILSELMHAATLAGVDPSEKLKMSDDATLNAKRSGDHRLLKKWFDKLNPEAQQIFKDVRDQYTEQRTTAYNALVARIESSKADGKTRKALISELRTKFEMGKVEGPYFPLMRFGDYWAAARGKDGETVAFSRFERASEQRQWVSNMRREGYTIEKGQKMLDANIAETVSPNFAASVTQLARKTGDETLADEIWQMYLRTLPEMSMRKAFMHRKGRLGFSADAMRAFGSSVFHGAHQIARLENMHVLEDHLDAMRQEAAKLANSDDEDQHWAGALYSEMRSRHEWAKNPKTSALSTLATSFGFAWYLGATPAAALVNLTQTPLVGIPVLGAEFGSVTNAGKALAKAATEFAGTRGSLRNKLRGDERKAFEEAARVGLFEKTQAADLAGIAEHGTDYSSKMRQTFELISWMFHKTEEANRQITFLAAYRLGREKGLTHDNAILKAEDMVWDTHFDYSNVSRPRYMQGDVARVLLLFRNYSLNMTYRLVRDARDSIAKNKSPEARKQARIRLGGILMMAGLFGGATGLPVVWTIARVLESLFDEPDDPYDAQEAAYAHLADTVGSDAARLIMRGPVDYLTGGTLSSRVSLSQLWVRDADAGLTGSDLAAHYLGEVAGPIFGIISDATTAASAANKTGDPFRALEYLMPKAAEDIMKSFRYLRDGAQNFRGDQYMKPEEFSSKDLWMQALGFTPATLQQRYDEMKGIRNTEARILGRRQVLMDRLFASARNGDKQEVRDTIEDIQRFNKTNPGAAISGNTIIQSAASRRAASETTIRGVRMRNRGLRYLHEEMRLTGKENEND